MQVGHLDCFSGVAGDMWVGALLDLGWPLAELRAAVATLGMPGVDVRAEPVLRSSIAAVHFAVEVPGRLPVDPSARFQPVAAHGPHRRLADIRAILQRGDLPAIVREQCDEVFVAIATAEARQHACSIDEVHFHEVGAEDTIVDVVGACLGTHRLALHQLYSSAVVVGSGTVRCAHGVLPVPAPGTLDLLQGIPVRQGVLTGERTTPTGAALLKVLVDEFEPKFTWLPGKRGHGAGTRDDADHPNLLRFTVGELVTPHSSATDLQEIVCTLDTATGETLGWLLDELLQRGAVDAFATAVQMKKGRPGYQITALCGDGHSDAVMRLLLEESSSLGVRSHRVQRAVLERWQEHRDTALGKVAFKVARLPSGAVVARPEDDEVKRLCRELGLGRREVLQRLLGA
jgi:hypothetical protein